MPATSWISSSLRVGFKDAFFPEQILRDHKGEAGPKWRRKSCCLGRAAEEGPTHAPLPGLGSPAWPAGTISHAPSLGPRPLPLSVPSLLRRREGRPQGCTRLHAPLTTPQAGGPCFLAPPNDSERVLVNDTDTLQEVQTGAGHMAPRATQQAVGGWGAGGIAEPAGDLLGQLRNVKMNRNIAKQPAVLTPHGPHHGRRVPGRQAWVSWEQPPGRWAATGGTPSREEYKKLVLALHRPSDQKTSEIRGHSGGQGHRKTLT